MKIKVDRIEGKFAVCELPDGDMKNIFLSVLPEGTKEGSIIEFSEKSSVLLKTEENEKRKENFERLNKLFSKNHLQ